MALNTEFLVQEQNVTLETVRLSVEYRNESPIVRRLARTRKYVTVANSKVARLKLVNKPSVNSIGVDVLAGGL